MSIVFFVLFSCCIALMIVFQQLSVQPQLNTAPVTLSAKTTPVKYPQTINEIPLPDGYKRIPVSEGSFAEWLRNIKLRKDHTVYLYNGNPKTDQNSHYAILDFSTGNKDLQQCADAIMRLRAEYFFSGQDYAKIDFKSAQKGFNFKQWLGKINSAGKNKHTLLLDFMQDVFINCGTYTLDAMTSNIPVKDMQPGDIFIKAGSPGHAMIIADVATHVTTGEKIYLLAQSFMPAQDIHIVINPKNSTLNPWYVIIEGEKIITPGWIFEQHQLKRWKN